MDVEVLGRDDEGEGSHASVGLFRLGTGGTRARANARARPRPPAPARARPRPPRALNFTHGHFWAFETNSYSSEYSGARL